MPGTKNKKAKAAPSSVSGTGTLYVVATPIGNLEDITLRALRILGEVDLIAAEDTRHTRKLLSRFAISTPTVSYYKDREQERAAAVIRKLLDGQNVALVSDAGTPGVSDPGSILVRQANQNHIDVIPIPGPSSLTTALSIAGLADNTFVFLGFAPARKKLRQDLLRSLAEEKKHMVFFEAPHRMEKFLHDCLEVLGDRQVFWCRELTKMHEELTHSTLAFLVKTVSEKKVKGESVLIIAGAAEAPDITESQIEEILTEYKKSGNKTLKDAVQCITGEYNLSRSSVYEQALRVWKKS